MSAVDRRPEELGRMSGRSRGMETWLGLGLPGGVLLLVVLGAYESRNRRNRPGPRVSTTYVNELTAMFYGTKRVELEHRDSMSLMRQEEAQGAPPRLGVDLDRGVVVLRPEDSGSGPGLRP